MARIVKEHTARRDEILDAGQRLIYTKGYERMTIQDILDDLRISKGAFYHYFGSKEAMLEAVIAQMMEEVERRLTPLIHNPHLTALEKFQRYFDTVTQLKAEQKPFLVALLRVWYTDDNAIVREKVRLTGGTRVVALLDAVIGQGIAEGTMRSTYPDQLGSILFALMQGLNETLARFMLVPDLRVDMLPSIERVIAAYTEALELVLGMPPGSILLARTEDLREWIALMSQNEDVSR